MSHPAPHSRETRHRPLHRRLLFAVALHTLAVAALFGLFAMVFVYNLEDQMFERVLQEEAEAIRLAPAQGRTAQPVRRYVMLHERSETLPPDLRRAWMLEPGRREFGGENGRHYHVMPMQPPAVFPILVAEVSGELLVRPRRDAMLTRLGAWALAVVMIGLALAWLLSRQITRPLQDLAGHAERRDPATQPVTVPHLERADEIGTLARGLDRLMHRTRVFVERERSFTRDVSHELRTPLAAMKLTVERMERGARSEDRGDLAALSQAIATLQLTVDALLMLGREVQSHAADSCAVLPIAERWVLAHAAWIEARDMRVQLDAFDRSDRVPLPDTVAELLLANLLANALQHGHGTVRLMREPGALVLSNPGTPPPEGAGRTGVKGAASAGFGLGLAIAQRLLEPYGAQLQLVHTAGEVQARVEFAREEIHRAKPQD